MKKAIKSVVKFVVEKTSKVFLAFAYLMLFVFVVSLVLNFIFPSKMADGFILSSALFGFLFSMFGAAFAMEDEVDEILNKSKI